MKKLFLMIVCALALSTQVVNAQDEVVTNALIIQLLDEGFSSEEIIGFIENASTREVKSDLQSMRELKQHNASAELIQYIQKIAKVDFGYDVCIGGILLMVANLRNCIEQILKLKQRKQVLEDWVTPLSVVLLVKLLAEDLAPLKV